MSNPRNNHEASGQKNSPIPNAGGKINEVMPYEKAKIIRLPIQQQILPPRTNSIQRDY